ncbi:MAG: PIN domain-containing protein [Candidatus Lokiarchaeota archaeon]|nr:PIN domain-containing protein [Candidatus Lokiarchaeota archaeon]
MKKLKIFLDTSVYSALFDERDLNRQKQTQDFWKDIEEYNLYYSDINIEEIDAIINEKLKEKLKALLKKGQKIEITEDVSNLTRIYINESLIPKKYENDALLIALTSAHSLDILVSWNFKHLVKRKTRIGVNLINLREGYKSIEILAPPEL